jgi:hypothetical protein
MKISEFKKLIREEVRKVIAEANTPTEAQDFAKAASEKYKSALLAVEFIKGGSGTTIVTAHVDIKKWRQADKTWANKYTEAFGDDAFSFKVVPKDASTFKASDVYGTSFPIK